MYLVFKFAPEVDPQATLKLKVEINTREHTNLLGIKRYPFALENDWYRGKAEIASSEKLEEYRLHVRFIQFIEGNFTQDVVLLGEVARQQ